MAREVTKIDQFDHFEQKKCGLTKKRSCTDCSCLILFLIYLGVWGGFVYYFLQHVDIEQVIFPSDSNGNVCGKGELSDRPYLYFFNIFRCAADLENTIIDGCNTPQICVKQCPSVTFSVQQNNQTRKEELKHAICKYNVKPNYHNFYELTNKEQCAKFYFRSEPIGGRCIPSVLKILNDHVYDEMHDIPMEGKITTEKIVKSKQVLIQLLRAIATFSDIFNDIALIWRWMLVGLIMTMCIAFAWISFMQWISRYMIWLSILALFALNIFIIYHSFNQYTMIKFENNSKIGLGTIYHDLIGKTDEELKRQNNFNVHSRISKQLTTKMEFDFGSLVKDSLDSYLNSPRLWLILIIVFSVVLVVFFLVISCLCDRIRLAVVVIEEASKAVGKLKSTLSFPIVSFLLKMIVIIFAVFAFVTISTGSQKRFRDINTGLNCIPKSNFDTKCVESRPFNRSMIYFSHAINLFGIIWVYYFIAGLCYITLAGVFANYYWTINKNDIEYFHLANSFGRCIRYHLGSVAFGSLLIAIVRFIRVILEYINKKCKKYENNVVSRFIMSCCRCCLWCLEKFIKFINKNAYIMMAVHGKSFCKSARDAFTLIISNGVRALVLSCLSGFLLFLSKLAVTCISGLIAYLFVSNQFEIFKPFQQEFDQLNNYWGPLIVFMILSYISASSFFNVYNVAIETIFLCYLEDIKMNDGTPERPYFMTKSLAKVFGKQNPPRERY